MTQYMFRTIVVVAGHCAALFLLWCFDSWITRVIITAYVLSNMGYTMTRVDREYGKDWF